MEPITTADGDSARANRVEPNAKWLPATYQPSPNRTTHASGSLGPTVTVASDASWLPCPIGGETAPSRRVPGGCRVHVEPASVDDAIRWFRVRWPGCRGVVVGNRRVVGVPGLGGGRGDGSGCVEYHVPGTGPHNKRPSVVPGRTGPPGGHWDNRTATRRCDDYQGGRHDRDLRVGTQRRPLHGAQELRPGHGGCCPTVNLRKERERAGNPTARRSKPSGGRPEIRMRPPKGASD